MAIRHPIPVETLRQLLCLDPETGRLYWRKRGTEWFRDGKHSAAGSAAIWNSRLAGKEAFRRVGSGGYLRGSIFDRTYLAHRVIFALANDRWPREDVDHRDGNRTNNRPDNLREASRRDNCRNTRGSYSGTSRFRGVHWNKRSRKWYAAGRNIAGAQVYLGCFVDEVAAAMTYDDFARLHYGEFARLNFPD